MQVAMFIGYRGFRNGKLKSFSRFSLYCLMTTLIFTLLTIVSLGDVLHSMAGLFERVTFGVGVIWLIRLNVLSVSSGWLGSRT